MQQEKNNKNTKEEDKIARAKKRLEEIKGFYSHLIIFLLVNGLLVIVNALSTPDHWWFYWVTIFWGFGLLMHALDVYIFKGSVFGRRWERRKMKKLLDEEDNIEE